MKQNMVKLMKICIGLLFVVSALLEFSTFLFRRFTYITDPDTGIKLRVQVGRIYVYNFDV